MALYDQNQNVAADPSTGTKGYTYNNGVLTSVGGTSTVTPNPSGSLQGTLTNGAPPTTPQVPQGGTQPTQTTQQPTAPGAGLDPTSFTSVLEGIKQKYSENNDLINAKNLLIKGLFTSPLSPDQVAALPPDIAKVYQSGNKDAIELQLQALNTQIQGGTNTFAQSVNYLVNGYQTSVQQAEQQKKDAIDTVQSFVSAYGSRAGEALKSLYGQSYVDTLKNNGIDINSFGSIPTIAESKVDNTTPGTLQERVDAALDKFANTFVPGATVNGAPVIDSNNFITPLAWKNAISSLPSGVSREDFIKRFGHLLYGTKDADGTYTVDASYGLTPVEMKLITGAL